MPCRRVDNLYTLPWHSMMGKTETKKCSTKGKIDAMHSIILIEHIFILQTRPDCTSA